MNDKEYRQEVRNIFERIFQVFEDVDPDLVEAELNQGTLTLTAAGKKTILSPQPPVQQIWLAVAAEGVALHFSKDSETGRWMDDKGQGHELLAYTGSVLTKWTGQTFSLAG